MKKYILFALSLCFLPFSDIKAEDKKQEFPIEFSFYNNGNFMPGKGILGIYSPKFHPGFRIGTRYQYLEKGNSSLYQSLYLGYFYHKHAQHGIQLYTNFIYRYDFNFGLFAEAGLGGGYLHSITNIEKFEWKEGLYERDKSGRAQWMADLSIKLGYSFKKQDLPFDLYLDYQFWLQSPFVNKYVPVLPHNSVHIGVIYYWNK